MNKDLYGKVYELDETQLENLRKYQGNEVIDNLLSNKTITYSNMKKIKHEMENGRKNELGGDSFHGWINQKLNSDRGSIDLSKETKKNSGLNNAYIRPHNKNKLNTMNRPSKQHSSFIDDIKINESLKRINQLIQKII